MAKEVPNFLWTCPYCKIRQRLCLYKDVLSHSCWIPGNATTFEVPLDDVAGSLKKKPEGLSIWCIRCTEDDCSKISLQVSIAEVNIGKTRAEAAIQNPLSEEDIYDQSKRKIADPYFKKAHAEFRILPETDIPELHEAVPEPIHADYIEAVRVRPISPKASATLCRRVIQAMIRDFHKISKKTLFQEIDAIRDSVDEDVWNAIDAVRAAGNIGAHPEKDINVIVQVELHELDQMIALIQLLGSEWYGERARKAKLLQELEKTGLNIKARKYQNADQA